MFRGVMNEHVYEYDELVIGDGLNALIYSYLNSKPLILSDIKKPLFFEFFPVDLDLPFLFHHLPERTLKGLKKNEQVGASKFEIWKWLLFTHSLAGLVPLSNQAASVRIEDKNFMKITTQNYKVVSMKFNKLRIFNDENIFGLEEPENQMKEYKVIDWIDVKSGMVHSYDFLESSNNFVKEVYFYPSERIDGNANKKDLVAISYLNDQELNDFDFSDTIARFKVLKLMKRAGIRGARNGKDVKNPNQYKYYALNIKPRKRELRKLYSNQHKNEENLVFDYRTDEQIINNEDCLIDDYCFKLSKTMLKNGVDK